MAKVILEKVGFKKDGLFATVDGKRQWLNCVGVEGKFTGKQVKDLIAKKYKAGDELPVELVTGNDGNLAITKVVMAQPQGGTQASTQTTQTSQPAETKKAYTPNNYRKNSDNDEGQRRGAVMHAVSRTMIALQGQVNVDNIESVLQRLYDFYYYSEPTPRG